MIGESRQVGLTGDESHVALVAETVSFQGFLAGIALDHPWVDVMSVSVEDFKDRLRSDANSGHMSDRAWAAPTVLHAIVGAGTLRRFALWPYIERSSGSAPKENSYRSDRHLYG